MMELSDEEIYGLRESGSQAVTASAWAALLGMALAHNAAKKQKPVAWVNLKAWKSGSFWPDDCFSENELETVNTPLYTSPPDLAEARELIEKAKRELVKNDITYADLLNEFDDFLAGTK